MPVGPRKKTPGTSRSAHNGAKAQPKRNTKSTPNKGRTAKTTRAAKAKSPNVTKASGLHPRNLHQGRYDFTKLEKACPDLKKHVIYNPRGEKSINFSDPQAVVTLNEALLKAYYGLDFWQIPTGYLCPPIPGRADYIHYLADLLKETAAKDAQQVSLDDDLEKTGSANHKPTVLDIGTGANCIYPLLGASSYDWNFVASDIDPTSVKTAQWIVKANKKLNGKIKVRHQKNSNQIFHGIIKPTDQFALTMCNPPFHESLEKAREGSLRKVNNLSKVKATPLNKRSQPVLNFAGTANELCCQGGEIAFLKQMAQESKDFSQQVRWFTSLVSKKENVALLQQQLKKLGAKSIKVVGMAQGQKISRFVAWSFLD